MTWCQIQSERLSYLRHDWCWTENGASLDIEEGFLAFEQRTTLLGQSFEEPIGSPSFLKTPGKLTSTWMISLSMKVVLCFLTGNLPSDKLDVKCKSQKGNVQFTWKRLVEAIINNTLDQCEISVPPSHPLFVFLSVFFCLSGS